MKTKLVCGMALLAALLGADRLYAQLRTVSIQKMPLGETRDWNAPRFSPDGKRIYVTVSDFGGIWEYTLATRSLRRLTADPGSGFGFAIAPGGKTLAFRRTRTDPGTRERVQEIVTVNLADGKSSVLESGETVSTPVFAGNRLFYTAGARVRSAPATTLAPPTAVIGVENTKIVLLRNGKKSLLDPLKGGSYIWPALSPDGKKLVAYEREAGTFVCDLSGRVQSRLGRRNAPSWTRDGRWIVFMRDADDGHNVTLSDIWCISVDGRTMAPLTETPSQIELYPDCSPVENKVVCSTANGEVLLLVYEEVRR